MEEKDTATGWARDIERGRERKREKERSLLSLSQGRIWGQRETASPREGQQLAITLLACPHQSSGFVDQATWCHYSFHAFHWHRAPQGSLQLSAGISCPAAFWDRPASSKKLGWSFWFVQVAFFHGFFIARSFVIGASVVLSFTFVSVSIRIVVFFNAPLCRSLGVSAALVKRSFDECLLIAWKQPFDQIARFWWVWNDDVACNYDECSSFWKNGVSASTCSGKVGGFSKGELGGEQIGVGWGGVGRGFKANKCLRT